jgi:hypothetical protein
LSVITRAWLFVRGPESIRIVIDGTSVGVYGPGERFSHSTFTEALDATLHQAAVEQTLVLDGWTLEQLTTERRGAPHFPSPPVERRTALRLVRHGEPFADP